MKLSDRVTSVSEFKTNAPKVIRELGEHREPVLITAHGKAKAVIQDIDSYERTQETLALLAMLARTDKAVREGKVRPLKEAFSRVRERVKK